MHYISIKIKYTCIIYVKHLQVMKSNRNQIEVLNTFYLNKFPPDDS